MAVWRIYVSNLTIVGPDNGLSPGRQQSIIYTNVRLLLISTLGTNFNEILRNSYIFIPKVYLKMLSVKLWQSCLDLNVLINTFLTSGTFYFISVSSCMIYQQNPLLRYRPVLLQHGCKIYLCCTCPVLYGLKLIEMSWTLHVLFVLLTIFQIVSKSH